MYKSQIRKIRLFLVLGGTLIASFLGVSNRNEITDFFDKNLTSITGQQLIRKSSNGICHTTESPYYRSVSQKNTYSSLSDCIKSGGREVREVIESGLGKPNVIPKYDRKKFEHWISQDGCINTRHKLLFEQSTSLVDSGKNKCTANYGRWYCPFTDQTFTNAKNVDIDHIVPLSYSWKKGSWNWTDEKRKEFSNDPANLVVVSSSANRSKGDKPFYKWEPPHKPYRCTYLLRFERVVKKYDLRLEEWEWDQMKQLKEKYCSK